MLPLYLLTNAKGQQMLIELKNGETILGQLTNVDNWMNVTLSNVTHTSPNEILHLPEIYLRGNFIKYIKLQDDIIDKVKQSNAQQQSQGHHQNRDFRRRQGDRRGNNDRRFNQGGAQRRNEGRGNYNNGGNRRSYGNRQGEGNNAMGGFVQHHQTTAQQPTSLGQVQY